MCRMLCHIPGHEDEHVWAGGNGRKTISVRVATVDLWASCEKNTEKVAVVLRGWRSWNSNWAPLESKDSRDMGSDCHKGT